MADMRQFVCHDAPNLACRQELKDAARRRYRRVVGIATSGESIGLPFVDQIHPGHRQAGALGKFPNHPIELRRRAHIDLARVVHLEHHLVREPVGEDVHRPAKEQGQQHPGFAADKPADDAEEGHDRGHQNGSFQPVSEHLGDLHERRTSSLPVRR